MRIYIEEGDIPGRHEKLGLIHARGDSHYTNQNSLIQKARRDAAKLGANGLLLRGIEEASQGAKVAAAFLGGSTQRSGDMVAIFVFPANVPGDQEEALESDGNEFLDERSAEQGTGPSFEDWSANRERQAVE